MADDDSRHISFVAASPASRNRLQQPAPPVGYGYYPPLAGNEVPAGYAPPGLSVPSCGTTGVIPTAQLVGGPNHNNANNSNMVMMGCQQQIQYAQPAPYGVPVVHVAMQQPRGPVDPAIVMLMNDASDSTMHDHKNFTTPLCDCWSDLAVCCNASFCTFCMGARQQNMMHQLPDYALQMSATGQMVINREIAEQTANNVSSLNWCCAGSFAFDCVRSVGGLWFPQLWLSLSCAPGVCLVMINSRQIIRQRLGIAPAQWQDCMLSWLCTPCAAGQQQLEMIKRGADPKLPIGTSSRSLPPIDASTNITPVPMRGNPMGYTAMN